MEDDCQREKRREEKEHGVQLTARRIWGKKEDSTGRTSCEVEEDERREEALR